MAIILAGAPLPPPIEMGRAKMAAPVAGSWSRSILVMGSRAETGQYGDRTGNEPGVSIGCQYWNVERDEKLVPMQLPLHTANPHEESNSPYELSQATRVHTMASSSLVAIPICYTLPFQYPTHILPLGVTASRSDASEKPYQCGKCGREFIHISELKVHMRCHTGEKPYKCGECSRRFGMLCALKTHMRTHTGEKPYRCEKCGKQFSQQSSLNKHMTIHTGEKPFNFTPIPLGRRSHRALMATSFWPQRGESAIEIADSAVRAPTARRERHARRHLGDGFEHAQNLRHESAEDGDQKTSTERARSERGERRESAVRAR
ncbi:ZNF569 [Branchiostoma lanceolatum]|uniref:ZNF569 protein n=1 Tax=Branchiostoma lanceolatum TaxID=7740 RepID=A0A8K0AE20_BRALA|nr:ZNF569 [Branchiostoma lanceolatum]